MSNDEDESQDVSTSDEWMRGLHKDPSDGNQPNLSEPSLEPAVTDSARLKDVRHTVLDEFDRRVWNVIETVMSAHLTLCIDGIEGCFGLIIEGPSGSTKTTALRAFQGLHGQFYRSDDVTPASFVSHDASRTDDELEGDDLLPRIKHKTLLNPEMANWFAGEWSVRSEKWARLVRVMDGRGFTSESGTHGQRGYTGDYRFNFVGATTPLDQKDWDMMGHTGNRFLFHEMPGRDDEAAYDDIFYSEPEYGEQVQAVKEKTHPFLRNRWQEYGGANGVSWNSPLSRDVGQYLQYLAELIRYARSPKDGEPESPHRVAQMLKNLARGHALLCGRREITEEDLDVCARVALSTMPVSRRPLVRALVGQNRLTTAEVMNLSDVTRRTAIARMELMEELNIGTVNEQSVQGGTTKVVEVRSKFEWPAGLSMPEF